MKYKKYITFDRFCAFMIIFINGWNYALPITDIPMPVWLTPIQLVHGIFIYELLIIFYLGYLVFGHGGKLPLRHQGTINMALLIMSLGCLGLLSNAFNLQPLKEFGEAARFFLLAVYFLLMVYWAKKYGPTFVLRTLLLGIVCSGSMNLYYAFTIRWMELGGLPFLLGQNGPGGPLGLLVILSAWLMMERKTVVDVTVSLAALAIGMLGASISYSKISMLIAVCGLIVWGGVVLKNIFNRRSRRLSIVFLALLTMILFIKHDQFIQYIHGVGSFIDKKFIGMTLEDNSITRRSQYFIITAEIMLRNPMFGVGYGGFYNAAISTRGFQSDRSNIEEADKGKMGYSNPHNSFLYYASANGFAGLVLTILIFMMTLKIFRKAFSGRGILGVILWLCLAVGYFIYGMTLPTLFNTSIMYLPAAAAVVFWRESRSILPSTCLESTSPKVIPIAEG